jgi:hypothetical protein
MTTLSLFEQETSLEAHMQQLSVLRKTAMPRASRAPALGPSSMTSILTHDWAIKLSVFKLSAKWP